MHTPFGPHTLPVDTSPIHSFHPPTHPGSAAMRAFVQKRVPDCKFLTDVGAEMVVQVRLWPAWKRC